MKTRTITLILLLMLAALCQFANAQTNEGDWTPTYNAQWWWKYVRPIDRQINEIAVSRVDVALVRSDRAGYEAHQVIFTLQNRGGFDFKGGNPFQIEYMYSDLLPAKMTPSAFKPAVVARGILPYLKVGQAIRVGGIMYTPEKSSFHNYTALNVGQ